MSNKAPKTTEIPNWDDLRADYLDQYERLSQVIDGLRALDRDPTALESDLVNLAHRIEAVDQMLQAVAHHQAA